ncbi:MAG: galactose oxidase, partial [Candidatus Dormibacteraeota bacterium]|nr:galactose oxidase [Candidatus Dormibacteraeota bacterium]
MWREASPIPVGWQSVGDSAVTGSDGRIYLFGDCLNPAAANSAYAYTPSTDTWVSLAPLPVPGCGTAVFGADGRIYVMTGGDNLPTSTEAYTPAANTWTVLAPLPLPSSGELDSFAAARGGDGRIYVFGGNGG